MTHRMVEIGDYIWRIEGGGAGGSYAIVGGVHGNERTGVEVVYSLLNSFQRRTLELCEGTLTLAIGNPAAVRRRMRGSEEGADLNRCFTHAILQKSEPDRLFESYEERRARELADALKDVIIGIDLHATNKPSEPFVVTQYLRSLGRSVVEESLNVEVVLTDPDWIFAGQAATLDEYFNRNGGSGICYETGYVDDSGRVRQVRHEMLRFLRPLISPFRPFVRDEPKRPRSYELSSAIPLMECGWRFAKGMGTHNFQPIRAGQVLGFHGDTVCRAKEDGVIVFPKISSLWRLGQPIAYLARTV